VIRAEVRVLTIAGSDCAGASGLQADLKTMTALGCYGMSVVTAVTAQDTRGVRQVHGLPGALVRSQLQAVLEDIGADAVKTGMLHAAETVEIVAAALAPLDCPVVVDPVFVSSSGHALLQAGALAALRRALLPRATLLTPNAPEAEALLLRPVRTPHDMETAARALLDLGPRAVLVKGGHVPAAFAADCLALRGSSRVRWLVGPTVETPNTRGTGCCLATAIACALARGAPLPTAVRRGRAFLIRALQAGAARRLGHGPGPLGFTTARRGRAAKEERCPATRR
jgi:hydroxymethylpyrimidine/phosphomethylpyrimidine kinase